MQQQLTIDDFLAANPGYGGKTYEETHDRKRLNAQLQRVYGVMRDSQWRTLEEIAELTGDGQASISARLRDLRKLCFGSHIVERRRRGDAKRGLFEYRVLV